MDRKYQYRSKNVHELLAGGMIVRVWSTEGAQDRATIKRLFEPLGQAGFVAPYLALMPDWHPGTDSVVGSVVPSREVLLPSVVGGDIGCGVCAVQMPLRLADVGDALVDIGRRLREVIPVGTAHNSMINDRVQDHGLWKKELR